MCNKSAVILVSGGMDSATAVYEAMEQGYEPYFLHTSYGQRTEDKEYECAKTLAEEVDAAGRVADLQTAAEISGRD